MSDEWNELLRLKQLNRESHVVFRTEITRSWLVLHQWQLFDHTWGTLIAEGYTFRRRRALANLQSWERVYLRRRGLY